MTTTKKPKWLLALVLVFGGFTVYRLFEGLVHNPAYQEYEWIFKIISEFGLFISVIVSVGYFHHWFIAAEEHKEAEISLRDALGQYVDSILLNSVKRGFLGITNKEFDFSQIMHGPKPGDYVYWLITFDPRFKNKSRELENAIKTGVHFRMLILKADCRSGELRAQETNGFNPHEFNEYSKLFKVSLEDVISRIDNTISGSLGVFVYDGLPSLPLFIIIRKESKSWKYITASISPSRFRKCLICIGKRSLISVTRSCSNPITGICPNCFSTTSKNAGKWKKENFTPQKTKSMKTIALFIPQAWPEINVLSCFLE